MDKNKEQWEKLKADGNLVSSLKDGVPTTPVQRVAGLGYVVVLAVILLFDVVFFRRGMVRKKPFLLTAGILCVWGWLWGILINSWDSQHLAWFFHPWACLGPFWLQSLEDWLFYPICGVFLLIVLEWVPNRIRYDGRMAVTLVYLALSGFFVTLSVAGFLVTVFFAVPGLYFFLKMRRFDLRHFLICGVGFSLFASVWDYLAVTFLHKYCAWLEHWTYVSFNAAGKAVHSSVFCDYPNFWFGMSPLEITPWFSIAGFICIYGLYGWLKERFQ